MAEDAEELDLSGDVDIPPLEDMSEYLEKAKEVKSQFQERTRVTKPAKVSSASKERESDRSTHSKDTLQSNAPNKTSDTRKEAPTAFGGFKKGFLFTDKTSQKKSTQKTEKRSSSTTAQSVRSTGSPGVKEPVKTSAEDLHDIPFIKPKDGGKSHGMEFPEVQEAMKDSYPFLKTQDWVTDDLLTKMRKHPHLSKVFEDPRLADIMSQFHSNPQAVFAAARENPEMHQFLQEFCTLMGDHFTALADEEEGKGRREKGTSEGPLISEAAAAGAEDAQMREILGRQDVQRALADPAITKLITTLKSNPDQAQRMLHSSNPDLQHKVKVLIDNGLLGVQRF